MISQILKLQHKKKKEAALMRQPRLFLRWQVELLAIGLNSFFCKIKKLNLHEKKLQVFFKKSQVFFKKLQDSLAKTSSLFLKTSGLF